MGQYPGKGTRPPRIAADYNASLSIDEESALQLVADADRFIERIRKYLTDEKALGTEDKEPT